MLRNPRDVSVGLALSATVPISLSVSLRSGGRHEVTGRAADQATAAWHGDRHGAERVGMDLRL